MNSHNVPPTNPEPLTADERIWAERLARIGPHDGPPPALDARILAAAHAAVAQRPRRQRPLRWPTLVGAAASLVIVVGLAWQLQPLLRTRPSLGEQPSAAAAAPSSEGALSEDVLAAANPVAQTAVNSPPPAPTVATTGRPPQAPRPPMAKAAPGASPTPASRSDFGDDAIPPYADYAGQATARQASRAAANRAAAPAPVAERRERASTGLAEPFPAAAADAEDRAAMPAPAAEASASSPAGSFAPPAAPAQKSTATRTPAAAATAEQDNSTLDRIEVTGSHINMAELPVRDDARLDPAAWLQRIRERRDGHDLDGARESLAQFRRDHPRVRVPDDLAQLGR